MKKMSWWKACLARSKKPDNNTAIRLNIRHADGSALDVEGPFTKAEADTLSALAIGFASKSAKASR